MKRPLGDYIHFLRKDKHETLKEASNAIGISYVFLSEIESGYKLPSEEVLLNVSKHFDAPFETLEGLLRQQRILTETEESSDPRVIAARKIIFMTDKDFSKIQRAIDKIGVEDCHDKI